MNLLFPWALIAIPLFFFALRLLRKKRTEEAREVADSALFQQPARWLKMLYMMPRTLAILAAVGAMLMMARPVGQEEELVRYSQDRYGCILLDVSGSMKGDRLKAVVPAAKEFVTRRPDDRFCYIEFADTAVAKMEIFVKDQALLHAALDAASAGGSTAIGDALFFGLWYAAVHSDRDLSAFSREGLHQELMDDYDASAVSIFEYKVEVGRFVREIGIMPHVYFLLLTDGANGAGISPLDALDLVEQTGIPVHMVSVGYDQSRNAELTRRILATGGSILSIDDDEDIGAILDEIERVDTRETVERMELRPVELSPVIGFVIFILLLMAAFLLVFQAQLMRVLAKCGLEHLAIAPASTRRMEQ